MPRKPIDYTNTHFYRIVCKDTSINDCYIGHTTDFKRRKSEHKNIAIWKVISIIILSCINLLEKMEDGTTLI